MQTQLSLWEVDSAFSRRVNTLRDQLELKYATLLHERPELGDSVSYKANKEIPLLRLYRYKEAFAYALVRDIIHAHQSRAQLAVLDPFCGMGTTLLTAALAGAPAWGVDRLPVGVFVANTLLNMLELESGMVRDAYEQLAVEVAQLPEADVAGDVAIMKVAFEPEILRRLRQWKAGILSLLSPQQEVMTLLLLSILEPCSYTSKDGQFLRLRRDKKPLFPDDALRERVYAAERDLKQIRSLGWKQRAQAVAILGDARCLPPPPFQTKPNLIVTS